MVLALTLLASELVYASRTGILARRARAASPPRAAASTASAAPVTPQAAAAPAVTEPAAPPIPADASVLSTEDARPGHRIFVDGRTLGQTPDSVLVKCGPARIKIGSAGQTRTIDLPCGREIRVR